MKRAELEKLTLPELYKRALESGVREAAGLPREAVIARLLGENLVAAEHPVAAAGTGAGSSQLGKPKAPATTSPKEPLVRLPSSVTPDRPSEQDPEAMARLYLAQGETARAIEIFRELLKLRPDDEVLTAALTDAELRAKSADEKKAETQPVEAAPSTTQAPRPLAPRPVDHGEPFGMLDIEELPEAYGIDECEMIAKDPFSIFVYWEVTDGGIESARRDLAVAEDAAAARLVMRIIATSGPGDRGPERETRDHALDWNHGRRYFPSPRPGARVRAAVGLVTPSGLFAPIANSSQVRVPPAEPAHQISAEWMEVAPPTTAGQVAEPPKPMRVVHRGAGEGERGVGTPAGKEAEGVAVEGEPQHPPTSSPWRWRPGSQS